MPQRASLLSTSSPFGTSIFSSSWNNGRGRASTLSAQLDDPSSPPRGNFRKDSLIDTDIRTLDYLGLVDPSPVSAGADQGPFDQFPSDASIRPMLTNAALNRIQNNRFRSYSVNAKEKYASREEPDTSQNQYYSGTITPSAEAAAQALAVTQAQIHQHNLDVQAFAHQASVSRPRAQTAGLLDSPSSRLWRNYHPSSSRLDNAGAAPDMDFEDGMRLEDNAAQALQMPQNHFNGAVASMGAVQITDDEASRALWIGNVPPSTTSATIKLMFEGYGPIESVRVLAHKGCAFVNFDKADSAIRSKAQLDGQDIFPGGCPVRIGYAKVQGGLSTSGLNGLHGTRTPLQAGEFGDDTVGGSLASGMAGLNLQSEEATLDEEIPTLADVKDDIIEIVKELGASHDELLRITGVVEQAAQFDHYANEVPPVPEPSHNRIHDAPRLRDIRKRIDSSTYTSAELEEVALGMLPELAELSSDYLGNTVVQKLFEYNSEPVKEAMLQRVAPHLAEIGVHKNGTWAAQKIIEVARTPLQMSMIVDGLRPYAAQCFLDQYGNYVMQGCLRFSPPWNSFIFETMLGRMWEVSQGRFGARAMRATLESHFASKEQQKMVAAAVARYAVPLSMNTNGSLLLTWYLDTCNIPNRRKVLAPRLAPYIVHLCTHKVAYLTILKIVNQRNEPEARDALLRAIFLSADESILVEILRDQACGVTLVFKILTTPFMEEKMRAEVMQKSRNALLLLKAQPSQGYKRLMDEVNMTTRGTSTGYRDSSRGGREKSDGSRPNSKHGAQPSMGQNSVNQGQVDHFLNMQQQYLPYQAAAGYQHQTNSGSPQAPPFDQYAGLGVNGINASHFQQNQAIPQAIAPTNHISYHPGRAHVMYNFPNPAVHAYATQSPQYPRNPMMASPQPYTVGSPAMMAQAGFHPGAAGYGPMMQSAWPQYPAGPYMVPQGMQGQRPGDGRRGRVGLSF